VKASSPSWRTSHGKEGVVLHESIVPNTFLHDMQSCPLLLIDPLFCSTFVSSIENCSLRSQPTGGAISDTGQIEDRSSHRHSPSSTFSMSNFLLADSSYTSFQGKFSTHNNQNRKQNPQSCHPMWVHVDACAPVCRMSYCKAMLLDSNWPTFEYGFPSIFFACHTYSFIYFEIDLNIRINTI